MKRQVLIPILCASMMLMFAAPTLRAQGGAAPAPAAAVADAPAAAPAVGDQPASGTVTDTSDTSSGPAKQNNFVKVLFGSGIVGTIIWFALFFCLGFYVYLVIDCSIVVRASKIMPQKLINAVEESMKEGDIVKALQCCDKEPGPMANILSAAFSHVEEGYEVVQEAIGTAADLEVERIMQKLSWFSVDANIAPMIGLLGTVQGMIMAFTAFGSGVPDFGVLGAIIGFSLWTTAAGLASAIPCIATYYYFRNNANRIVLRMEAITMELVKDLRHVQVVTE